MTENAYNLGYRQYWEDHYIDDNPFEPNHEHYQEWIRGFEEAEADYCGNYGRQG